MSDSTPSVPGRTPPDELPVAAGSPPPPASPVAGFQVGDRVVLAAALTYLKTADPMPMLRPPDLVDAEEQGQVVEIRALGQLAVRFRRGTFLLGARDLRTISAEP
ncbi:MAG: NAD(P)H dehydrogenase assembly family protein [Synechococcaceae cyanobacterium ELA739]